MQSTLEEMKAAISPADARLLSQKIWSLSQQHIDLVTAIAQNLSNAEDKLDLIPTFDSRLLIEIPCHKCLIIEQKLESYVNSIFFVITQM